MILALAGLSLLAAVPAGLRWLRVAQREHYLAGEVTRSAARWRRASLVNYVLELVGFAAMIAMIIHDPRWSFVVPLIAAIWPVGLSVKGVTSPLAWTDRLGRLAAAAGLLVALGLVVGSSMGEPLAVVLPVYLLYAVVDLALWLVGPLERRAGAKWVEKAAAKIASLQLDVVAITGSYGKTTTKNYVAHLLGGVRRVVASPASFNNRMGLARAINENLTVGTEVFVAEMGTYGRGEIAELCEWIPPKVAAMVAIGPVHLERFGTVEEIVRAKSEILDRAEVGVICVDHPLLAAVARERADAMDIIEVSARDGIVVGGRRVVDVPPGVFAANLAVALGICQVLGVDLDEVLPRIGDLPTAEHRQSVTPAAGGFTIVDDTFNSNPDGARSALATLLRLAPEGKTAVITPGMVELGPVQEEENRSFAAEAAAKVDHLVIVGRTNRSALVRGSTNGRASVTVVGSRQDAVEWAKATLGPGDAVLYENDLPDHYP